MLFGFFFTSPVGHYKKSYILFCKTEMLEEQKKQIHHYTMHTQIFTMLANRSIFAIFFQKYFNSKYNLATYFNRELSNNSIWTSTDIPNACRDIIVLYVSDTWTSNTWIFNILFCTRRPGPGIRLCDTDSDRSWHG